MIKINSICKLEFLISGISLLVLFNSLQNSIALISKIGNLNK